MGSLYKCDKKSPSHSCSRVTSLLHEKIEIKVEIRPMQNNNKEP